MIKRPRAVLFDYDGVLVASEPIHLSAWLQLLDELGLPRDQKIIQAAIGKTAPEILSQILDRYRPGWSAIDYPVHQLAQRKNDIYVIIAEQELSVYPGVVEGLQWLRSQKIAVAVVSNGRRKELERTMRHLGLFEQMDEVVSRDDAKASKPDPTPYLFAAACLGVEVQDCMAVEDSPTGLESALMAKIPTAALMTNFSREAVERPVPGRPDLQPVWIGQSIIQYFQWIKSLPI